MSKNKTSQYHRSKKTLLMEVLLVVSALIMGFLIVLLVYRSHTVTRNGEEQTSRELTGAYPSPSEIIPEDKSTYFAIMEIPNMIFSKMEGVSFPENCPVSREELRYVKVLYWGFDASTHQGELVVNASIAEDVQNIFYDLYRASYPIERIELVDNYGGNDEVSMANNNTSAFNGRVIAGTDTWSNHAYGLAIDLNPFYNPYVGEDGKVLPVAAEDYADRSKSFAHKIDQNDYAYKVFIRYGFSWGGSWDGVKDYQHFEKIVN